MPNFLLLFPSVCNPVPADAGVSTPLLAHFPIWVDLSFCSFILFYFIDPMLSGFGGEWVALTLSRPIRQPRLL